MKTAKEMYDYSVANKFGDGMMGFGLKSFGVVEKNLLPDEKALICFIGLHKYVSATEHAGNFAYAITNKRLILGQKKILGEAVQIINLDNINDITKTSGPLYGFITFDTYKECFKVGFSNISADKLYPVINDYFSDFKGHKNPQPAATPSDADELIKFKKLLDAGIITQADFDAKKKQILGL